MTKHAHFHTLFGLVAASLLLAVACESMPTPVNRPKPAAATGPQSLADLIAAGKTAEVRQRFTSTDSVNQKNAQGQSLLHIAALKNDAEMTQFLIDMKADKEATDAEGQTPMQAAVKADCLDATRVLAGSGASIFAVDSSGATVYDTARAKGRDALSAIVSKATVAEQDQNGRTALHHAVSSLDEEAVALVLSAGGSVSAADNAGKTPLAVAYANPVPDASARIAATLLLARSEPVGGTFSYFETAVIKRNLAMRFEEGKTPLHIASAAGHTGFVKYLIERKAPVNAKDVSSSTPLHEAVRGGYVDCTSLLLGAGADPNMKDSSGNTPLHLVMPVATRSEIFGKLLAARADPNQKDNYGETPLHIAARLGMSEDIVRALVSSGADANERNKKGVTPLSLAIERNQASQANLLVRLGSDIHAEDIEENTALTKALRAGLEMTEAIVADSNVQSRDSRGRTALHVAVINRADPAIISFLVSKKADVNARDKNGDTALHIAIRNNDRASGEILLANGADVFTPNVSGESALKAALTRMGGRQDWVLNSTVIKSADGAGNTPLHLAAEWQLTAVVALIIDKGGDPNARNANGETPIFNAVKADSALAIRTLLAGSGDKKADVNARDFLGNTALHSCVRWAATGAADALIAYDAKSNARKLVNARNLAGKTALHEAARTGNVPFVRSLIAAGADINAVDDTGKTALTDAIRTSQTETVKFLLDRGASPVMQDMYGRNAFHEAVENSSPEIVVMLRNAGGNPMARDSWGKTPLSLAFRKSGDAVMAVIGSNVNLVDSDGNTPLHMAVTERASDDILKMLLAARFPVNNRNRSGSTALMLAVKAGSESSARILLAAGADPFASDNSASSAVTIALAEKKAFIPVLAEYCADGTDTIGDGILHYAARVGDAETVKELLNLPRIDRAARNIAGETAYDVAIRWQRADIAELLR
jgi:ankyrin repeat protein